MRTARDLEQRGIHVLETDLGERIQQLDREPPSHVVVPAVHKLRNDVAQVFARTIGTDPNNHDVHYLAESQRQNTQPAFLEAGAGLTGSPFGGLLPDWSGHSDSREPMSVRGCGGQKQSTLVLPMASNSGVRMASHCVSPLRWNAAIGRR
jgi:hypothetical protein